VFERAAGAFEVARGAAELASAANETARFTRTTRIWPGPPKIRAANTMGFEMNSLCNSSSEFIAGITDFDLVYYGF
jgi:hypothetical protein